MVGPYPIPKPIRKLVSMEHERVAK